MIKTLIGDCRKILRDIETESIDCVVTSIPYWGQRDYDNPLQIGWEKTPQEFVAIIVGVFQEVFRVLKKDGNVFINVGDSYISKPTGSLGNNMTITGGKRNQESGLKRMDKSKCGIPEKNRALIPQRLAIALQENGWFIRQEIIWNKPNGMPYSSKDRCRTSHEQVWHITKTQKNWFDIDILDNPESPSPVDEICQECEGEGCEYCKDVGVITFEYKSRRSVWNIPTQPHQGEEHTAIMPDKLVSDLILCGCRENGTVLDPFGGTGTTGLVAELLNRDSIIIELNGEYLKNLPNRKETPWHTK